MSSSVVDWNVAFSTAERLVKPGPDISRDGASAAVAELRDCAQRAEAYVAQVTGLSAGANTAPVLIVDRPGWIQANLDGFRQILAPLNRKALDRMQSEVMVSLGSRVTGVEVGAMLSYLAPKVLGQFDPFYPGDEEAGASTGGRLLLVAPNIVSIERELSVDPGDFRLWVCLHEETHRVQFTAVPWLRSYLNGEITNVVDSAEIDGSALAAMLRDGVAKIAESLISGQEVSIVDLVQTPAQRATVERITAVMSLLEGHADVVMDGVGPEVIGSIESIRRKFNIRRQGQGFDKVVRKLLGLDAKMRQYRDGAEFCRRVMASVGMDGFNQVWTSPDTLPTKAEIADADIWLRRVHGRSADQPSASV